MGIFEIAIGGKDLIPFKTNVIFSKALKVSASKIILVHYHSLGIFETSPLDKAITNKSVEAGTLLDIEVCDHIIVSEDVYYVLKDVGY